MAHRIGDVRPHKYLVLRRDGEIAVFERVGGNKIKIHRWGGDEDDSVYSATYDTSKAKARLESMESVGWLGEFESASSAGKLIDKLRK